MPNISGDASQLKQAFYNILKNSIQAMPEGGKIIITCSYDDDFVEISFGDSGCGIDAGQMKNIMNPYFTTKSKGNGLGMMVLERILRGHGAELSIDSEPAKGTIVTIRFPRYGRRMRVLPEPENTNMEGKEWPNR
jgi:signal transduction histidine kinase